MATYYRTGVETYSIIGTADEKGSLEGRIPDGSTYFAVDENMFYTFYDGQWYETLPEAARLYHDDVGTDTKPIKLVGGVATVVANELAEDSKVVHLAGTETITGAKTFTANDTLSKKTPCRQYIDTDTTACYGGVQIRSAYLVTGGTVNRASEFVGVRDNPSNPRTRSKITARAPNGSSDAVMQLVTYDSGTSYAEAPSYHVDYAADNKIMTRGMLAQTPTVVHTTGNETIAGNKTFSGQVAVGDLAWCRSVVSLNAGIWSKAYEYPRTASSGVVMRVFNNFALTATLDTRLVWSIGAASGGYTMAGKVFTTASLAMKLARRASDNVMEVWLGNTSATANMQLDIECEHFRTSSPVPSVQAGSAPEVGNVYSEVVDAQVVSP